MRIGTLFSGIGAPEQGARRVYDDLEMVFACEWEKFARQSFKAIYDIDDNHFHKDINEMDGTQYKYKVDIVIGGSPCQDFSIAGLRAGIDGHRGQLIWQYYRIIKEIMPPIFIYENVKGMVSDKNGQTLKDFLEVFRDLGYSCHSEVLNTKDYGVPQNRERIYIIGFLDHEHYYRFEYAPKQKLEKRLKDVLEGNVDRKYYLSEVALDGLKKHKERHKEAGNGFGAVYCDGDDVAPTIKARYYKDGNECLIKEQTDEVMVADRIRKLTPIECLRLQDFPDQAHDKAKEAGVSNSQLYKQAGNSMSVNVLEMIFTQIEASRQKQEGSLF